MHRHSSLCFSIAIGAFCCAAFLSAHAFTFSSIEHWSGNGSSRAALVVDWHDGTRPHALVWGVRFDGAATALDLWNTVTTANSGLSGTFDNGTVTNIIYNRLTRPGDILPGTGEHPGARKTAYAWDHAAADGTWTLWRGNGATYAATNLTRVATALAATVISDGDWFALSFSPDAAAPQPPGHPAAALHYPFATTVVDYYAGGVGWDWVSFERFDDPSTALGRPTVDTTGDDYFLFPDSQVPVVPVYPALRARELVSIGLSGGQLTLAFDHPVFNNPDNPYGADFIVFGNSLQEIGKNQEWANGDPNLTLCSGTCSIDGGHVDVSQDGITWYRVTSIEDRTADDFAPTLGRVYDTNRADTALGGWNAWWGGATDPTIPVAPSVTPSDLFGKSVATVARHYRGSAGGTAFDIGGLPLTVHPDTGTKWIRYVRVTPDEYQTIPEIDAIADVSPALPIDRWRDRWFAWLDDPDGEDDHADPDGDGLANLMEYGLGRDPTNAVADPVFTVDMRPSDAPDVFRFFYTASTNAPDVSVGIVHADDLANPAWGTNGVRTATADTPPVDGAQAIVSEVPTTGARGFMRLRVQHDE